MKFFNSFGISFLLSAILISLFSLWVPLVDDLYVFQKAGNLFFEIKPRALLGTISNLFDMGDRGLTGIKVAALYCWLALVVNEIQKNIFRDGNKYTLDNLFILVAVSLVFAFSTVSQTTFGKVKIFDSVPYFFVLSSYIIFNQSDNSSSRIRAVLSTLLISVAILSHEKTLFDIAILFLFLCWKKGFVKALIFSAPPLIFAAIFLTLTKSKSTTGLAPQNYFEILSRGTDFFLTYSFNIYGVILGGGSLWILYIVFVVFFLKDARSRVEKLKRLALIFGMLTICICPLIVAWDVSRLVGLIWLPTILIMQEIKLTSIFKYYPKGILSLATIVTIQLLIPPIFWIPNGGIALNRYAEWASSSKFIVDQNPIHRGEVLFFGNGKNGANYVYEGWHSFESWGLWSSNSEAKLKFNFVDPNVKKILINVRIIKSKNLPNRVFTITINDQYSEEFSFQHDGIYTLEVNIPAELYPKPFMEAEYSIKIKSHTLVSPIDAGLSQSDDRTLGIGLNSIKFE